MAELFGDGVANQYHFEHTPERMRPAFYLNTIATMRQRTSWTIPVLTAFLGVAISVVSKRDSKRSLDTLRQGEQLCQGTALKARGKDYYAILQNDGNFVVYRSKLFVKENAIWCSNSQGIGTAPYLLEVSLIGEICIKDKDELNVWSSWGPESYVKNPYKGAPNIPVPFRLVMQDDRNLVVKDKDNRGVWSTRTTL
ncbi:hypothetical protein AKO1_012181 [Acrasis kona]|uniref:Bulb-type lectin domain-containing protein n=1 Tax=Acrasis kona TaxID=1008807 RepID=A0AAW2ZD10_9EUKA